MTKKYLAFIVVFLLLFSLIPVTSFAQETGAEPAEEPIEVTEPEEEAEPAEESPEPEAEPAEEAQTDPATDSTTEATEDTEKSQDSEVDLEETLEMPLFPASMAPMGTGPVSLSINGSPVDEYADLDSAFTVLKDTPSVTSAVVEITEAGVYPSSSFSFNGFDLTIRGATGIRPEITMDDESIQFSGATLTIQNVDLSMSNALQDYTFGIGKFESPFTVVTLNDTNLRLDGKDNTTKFAIQFFSTSDNVTLNIVNQSEVFVTGYKGGNPGNAIYTESENIKTVNITDSTFISDDNRSGWIASGTGDKLLAVNVTRGVLEVINSTGNGSNGGNVNVSEGSLVTFNDNFDNGLSVNWLKVNDSTVKVGRNGANGIVARTGLWVENSEITVIENKEKLISQWTQPGGIYLNQSTDTVSTIDGQSTVSILGNSGPGLHLYQGSLIVAEGAMLTVKDNKAYDDRVDGLYAKGAGVYLRSGTLVLPKSAVIYNNRAANEADDIFVADGAQLALYPVGTDWTLEESPEWDENHLIDGWYHDAADKRWSAHIDPIHVVEHTDLSEDDSLLAGPLTLKAAHALLVDIPVEKVWVDGPLVKPTITIHLLADGEVVASVDLENGVTEYTFENFPKFANDQEIVYSVTEDVVENYLTTIKLDEETGKFIITNTFVSPKIDITVNKVWIDGPEVKPEISVQLYRNGDAYGDPVVIKSPELTYTWKDLDELDKEGNPYNYTVDELEVPTNYEKTVDGLTITNRYVIPKIDVTAKKTWVDGPAEKPDVTLQLMKDGKAFGDPVVLKHPAVSYTWKDLDQTTAKGEPIVYTVDELNVPEGYVKTASGLEVTNTFMMAKTDITATKKWVGGPEKKPVIQLQLYRDGKAFGEVVELDGVTTYTWKDLDKHSPEGKVYVYTVKEPVVPNYYKATYSEDGLTVTNTWTKEELPKTGMGSSTWMLILGGLLLIGGAVVFLRKKQNGNAS